MILAVGSAPVWVDARRRAHLYGTLFGEVNRLGHDQPSVGAFLAAPGVPEHTVAPPLPVIWDEEGYAGVVGNSVLLVVDSQDAAGAKVQVARAIHFPRAHVAPEVSLAIANEWLSDLGSRRSAESSAPHSIRGAG